MLSAATPGRASASDIGERLDLKRAAIAAGGAAVVGCHTNDGPSDLSDLSSLADLGTQEPELIDRFPRPIWRAGL